MIKYQCNVCAKTFDSFNDAAMCHPDVNILDDVPQENSRPTNPTAVGLTMWEWGNLGVCSICGMAWRECSCLMLGR